MSTTQCLGFTVSGKRCTYKVKTTYCRYHKPKQETEIVSLGEELSKVGTSKKKEKKSKKSLGKKEELKEEEEENCPVCMEPVIEMLSCKHRVHMKCQIQSGSDLCPLCRQKVVLKKGERAKMIVYQRKYNADNVREQESQLRQMVENERSARILHIMRFLEERGLLISM